MQVDKNVKVETKSVSVMLSISVNITDWAQTNVECVVVIDSLEQSLVAALPRLIRDELCRGLTQQGSVVSQQIASRLDVSVNNTSPVMLRAGSASLTPISALQLLRSGQVNSAFEKVTALLPDHSCCVFKNKHICKVARQSDVQWSRPAR